MQSFGLALTTFLLTGTLVALDLSDIHVASPQQILVLSPHASSTDVDVTALSIMPHGLPGLFVPKADINNGVFAVGSSTGREGLDNDEQDVGTHADEVDDEVDASDSDADKGNDFVLI